MSPSLTSTPPRADHGAGTADELAADLADIARRERIDRRTRLGLTVGFALIAVALAGPILPALPVRVLAAALLVTLATVGAYALAGAASSSLTGHYEARHLGWRVWRWRIVRRWYAPGSTVWRTDPGQGDGPLAVLGWSFDPACGVPWALVYDGTPLMSGGAAVWLPVTALSPTPPSAERLGGAEIGGPL